VRRRNNQRDKGNENAKNPKVIFILKLLLFACAPDSHICLLRNCALTESMSYNAEFNELFRKTHAVLTILAQQELPPKLWPNSSTKKLVMVNAILKHGSFLIYKWDPSKKGTKQLHEINIENKMESMKRIADIANLSLDMSKLKKDENIISRAKHSATIVSNNDRSWNATFAMLVEYVGENFRLPFQRDGPTAVNDKTKLGKWYNTVRNKSHTTARGDRMLVMKAITAIMYNGNRLRNNLGPSVKNNVKKMISELKSLSPS
jgi:hypothetical protein